VLLAEALGRGLSSAERLREARALALLEELATADQKELLLPRALPEADCRELPEALAPLL
jgi:hypothetical protein